MNYIIRKIRENEYHLLEAFIYEAIFIPEGAEPPPKSIINQPDLQVYIKDFGTKKDDICFVAEVESKIVGAVWVRDMKDYGHIEDGVPSFAISLYKEYRNHGIGTGLMVAILDELRQRKYEKASLAVQKANYAVKMYKKVGFVIIGENDEEYIMLCNLRPTPYESNTEAYTKADDIIDFRNDNIAKLAESLSDGAENELEYVRKAYEFVRDKISHSADIGKDAITCSASEVLENGHGICFAKSHLLAALLRYKGIPAGFCYQKLILDDETAPFLVYHGLNGVYISEYKKWIRLDARGNKNGVNAQFTVDEEQLAFPVRSEKNEIDGVIIFADPDAKILEKLKNNKTRSELWHDLPTELAYNS